MSDAETTAPKQQVGIPFKPGQSGNPKGRPKGSRNKLGEEFLAKLHADFQEHGEQVLADVRKEKPDAYLRVVASILPKELNISHSTMDELSDDELADAIDGLKALLASGLIETTADGAGKATKH